jgi:hypothetical protein
VHFNQFIVSEAKAAGRYADAEQRPTTISSYRCSTGLYWCPAELPETSHPGYVVIAEAKQAAECPDAAERYRCSASIAGKSVTHAEARITAPVGCGP